jgi:hypothetical protein
MSNPPTRVQDLTPAQRAALGHLAHASWGAPPKRSRTWASLRERGLVKFVGRTGERGLLLTDDGKAAVAELEAGVRCSMSNPRRFSIPHGRWAVIPNTGLAVYQATGSSVIATDTGDDVVLDTDGAVRVRLAEITGPWTQGKVYATPLDGPPAAEVRIEEPR